MLRIIGHQVRSGDRVTRSCDHVKMHVKGATFRIGLPLGFHKASGKLDQTSCRWEGFISQTLLPTFREKGACLHKRSGNAATRPNAMTRSKPYQTIPIVEKKSGQKSQKVAPTLLCRYPTLYHEEIDFFLIYNCYEVYHFVIFAKFVTFRYSKVMYKLHRHTFC